MKALVANCCAKSAEAYLAKINNQVQTKPKINLTALQTNNLLMAALDGSAASKILECIVCVKQLSK